MKMFHQQYRYILLGVLAAVLIATVTTNIESLAGSSLFFITLITALVAVIGALCIRLFTQARKLDPETSLIPPGFKP